MIEMQEIFCLAAVAACGLSHTALGKLNVDHMILGKERSTSYVDADSLTSEKQASIIRGIDTVLSNNSSQNILIGDRNHGDLRIWKIFGSPEAMDMLSRHGFRNIFLEVSPKEQDDLVAIARYGTRYILNEAQSYLGPRVASETRSLRDDMTCNARDKKIDLYGSDVTNNFLTDLLVINMQAMRKEAKILTYIGLRKLGNWWAMLGNHLFAAHRHNDKKTGKFINDHSRPEERNLIIYGSGHVVAGGKNAMRENLPNNMVICIYDNLEDKSDKPYGALRQTADASPTAFRTPDYVADLATGSVMPYPAFTDDPKRSRRPPAMGEQRILAQ